MLRRKPTALTITTEDIAAFEDAYLRKIAYAKYLKTGEDPQGYFRSVNRGDADAQMQGGGQDSTANATTGTIDPNDELKPLPGDKARIVRSREERIAGAGGGR